MANNKRRKKVQTKSKTKNKTKKKKAARKTVIARSKQSKRRALSGKKVRPAARKKRPSRSRAKEIRSPEPSTLGGKIFSSAGRRARSGSASSSAGQSGDLQALSRKEIADSESVEELLEEGQAREAAAISGVEDAPEPDEGEVRTHEVQEDDVPGEYTDED